MVMLAVGPGGGKGHSGAGQLSSCWPFFLYCSVGWEELSATSIIYSLRDKIRAKVLSYTYICIFLVYRYCRDGEGKV